MHRIDAPGHAAGLFTEGDVQGGIPPTHVSADWLNAVQEEIAEVVEGTGRVLSKPNNAQLADSIYEIVAGINGYRNVLLNGDFSVNQRKAAGYTITTGVAAYCLDRWRFNPGAANAKTITITQQAFSPGQSDVPGDPTHFIRWNYGSANSFGSPNPRLEQRVENVWTLQGRVVTLTFWARVTAGSSTITPTLSQYFGAAGSSAVNVSGAAAALSTTWTKFSYVLTLASTVGKTFDGQTWLELRLETPKDYLVTTGSFELADVQLEVGQRSTPFERRPFGEMRRLCERYYETTTYGGAFASFVDAVSSDEDTLSAYGLNTRFRAPKRALPTVTWYAPSTGATGSICSSAVAVAVSSTDYGGLEVTGIPNTSGALAYCQAHWTAEAEL